MREIKWINPRELAPESGKVYLVLIRTSEGIALAHCRTIHRRERKYIDEESRAEIIIHKEDVLFMSLNAGTGIQSTLLSSGKVISIPGTRNASKRNKYDKLYFIAYAEISNLYEWENVPEIA